MKYAIVGSRKFPDMYLVEEWMRANLKPGDTVVSGGAFGVDSFAETVADEMGIPARIFNADWKTYGKSAGFVRNKLIVDESDIVIAFWDGSSNGTKHTIGLAKKTGKATEVFIRRVKSGSQLVLDQTGGKRGS